MYGIGYGHAKFLKSDEMETDCHGRSTKKEPMSDGVGGRYKSCCSR